MQQANVLLTMLNNMGKKPNNKFDKLYPKLYNKNLWLYAYQRIYAKPGNMTPGVDGQTIDGMSEEKIEKLISDLKASRYKPQPVRRSYIDKPNGGKRPLGIPCWEDKLLQTVVKLLLEAIYEPKFLDVSHGFRPQRSCHTALERVKKMNGVRWWVEGDIKGCFDTIDHDTLRAILGKVITDKRFLHLIRQLLEAGYMEDWQYHKTYSGTPQGGNLSPLLSNIYLHELDTAIMAYKREFDKGQERARERGYARLSNRRYRAKIKARKTGEWSTYRELGNQLRHMKATQELDPNFRRLTYVRYAHDFVIGINGSKEDAKEVKEWLKTYLREKLKLTLSDEKTWITNAKDSIRFLSYDIKRWGGQKVSRRENGVRARVTHYCMGLFIPKDKVRKFVKRYGNPQGWKGQRRPELFNNSELEILMSHNAAVRGFLNYYAPANNFSQVGSAILHMAAESFFRSIAGKRRSSRAKVMRQMKAAPGDYRLKININGEIRQYQLVSSTKQLRRRRRVDENLDKVPKSVFYNYTEVGQRLAAKQCQWCGLVGAVEVHHIKKLKDLKGKADWEKVMIARQRKTLVLCLNCHDLLHAGKLQPMKFSQASWRAG